MFRNTTGLAAALILAATTGATAPLTAQAAAPQPGWTQVEEVRAEATDLAESKRGFLRASILFRRAADLGGERPAAIEDLLMAGRLAYYSGRKGQAAEDLARAAEAALGWGDVLTAARAYLDAAWISHEDGNDARALEWGTRAERLSHSPLIEGTERMALRARLSELP